MDWSRKLLWSMMGLLMVALILLIGRAASSPSYALRIGDPRQPCFGLMYIAKNMGFFEIERLHVELVPYRMGREALASTIEGKTDFAMAFETPVVIKTLHGERLAAITSLHEGHHNSGVVARRGRGIVLPAHLKGKTIAVTKDTSSEYLLRALLTSEGIAISEVKLMYLEPLLAVLALKEGRVDAVTVWNPHLYRAQHALPLGELVTFYADTYTEMSLLIGLRDRVLRNREASLRLLRGLLRAEEYQRENPDKAIEIIAQELRGDTDADVRAIAQSSHRTLRLSNVLLTSMQQQGEWLQTQDEAHYRPHDFRSLLLTEYLTEVSPDSVTIPDLRFERPSE